MNLPELRQAARQIWGAALEAATPETCIRENLNYDGGILSVCGKQFDLDGRLIVIGAGKAAARMAQVVEEVLGDRIATGLVVTKYDHGLPLRRVELREAGHPIPDANGVHAVDEMRTLLTGLRHEDIVLCLISGGGSALWPSPAQGITLDEKQTLTSLLLRAGATIRELNAVRKHLSSVKGGQLARWVQPARIVSLIMSDVIGDPLDFIASGPTAPDTTSFKDALSVVQKYGVDAPTAALSRLRQGAAGQIEDTPKLGDSIFSAVDNFIIANNTLLLDAALRKAIQLGFRTIILASEIEGEAKDIGGFFAAVARETVQRGNPIEPPVCILAAGETTVTVRGSGKGGRNQEMALAWAMAMSDRSLPAPCCFASVASDGTDGPTDAAGGLVDTGTCSRAAALGMNPGKSLQANDSYPLLKATGDLIVTGPTYTNLMYLQILLVG